MPRICPECGGEMKSPTVCMHCVAIFDAAVPETQQTGSAPDAASQAKSTMSVDSDQATRPGTPDRTEPCEASARPDIVQLHLSNNT